MRQLIHFEKLGKPEDEEIKQRLIGLYSKGYISGLKN
jgi:hypothetical protein